MRITVLALVLVAGCAQNKRSETPSSPKSNGPAVDAAVTVTRTSAQQLDDYVTRAQVEFHAAADDAAVTQIEERYARLVADDVVVTDASIASEITTREGYIADLHSGAERVYPDRGTMNAMRGVPGMLRRALALRGRPAPAR